MRRFAHNILLKIMPTGIRSRLFLLISLVLVPLMMLLGYVYYQRYQARFQIELQTQLELSEVVGASFRTYIEAIHNQSLVTGKAILSHKILTQEEAEELLSNAADRYRGIRNLSWVSPDGTILASSDPDFKGRSLARRDYFQRTLKNKHVALGDLTETGTITPAPTVALATAVTDDIGFLRGIVVAGLEPTTLSESILVPAAPFGGGYVIFDSKGVVVFRCPEIKLSWEQRTDWIKEDVLMERIIKTKKPQAGFATVAKISPEQWIAARVYIPELGWYAGTGRPDYVAFGGIKRELSQNAIIAACVCGLAFLLAYMFSRTISTPIVRLQTDARKMGRGEIQQISEPYAPYEVQNLREQVEEMASSLISQANEIKQSEETTRGILDSTYDAILLHDEQANIIEVNKRFEELYAVDKTKALEISIADISGVSSPLEKLPDIYSRVLRGEQQLFEWKARRVNDGKEFDVEVYLNKLMMHGKPMILATMRDITQRKQSERQLTELTNDLKAKNEELESIINITSHDLKSPVVNIMGFSGELTESVKTLKEKLLQIDVTECRSSDIMSVLDKEIPEEMEFIKKSTRSIDQMLQSLSKVVHTVLAEIHITRVNANDIIASILSGFKERIEKKRVDVTMEILPECLADKMLLREVFFNVIENAITYLVPERPGKIFIGGYVKDNRAIYMIKDNGRGIAPAHQENIFKLFHKLDVSAQGEGIGLTVSRRLVERQSGRMWVESEPDKGSTFYIQMPKA